MNIVYNSPFFNTSSVIPAVALKTYQNRDAALLKLRGKMLAARRKIEREGWYSQPFAELNGVWTVVQERI